MEQDSRDRRIAELEEKIRVGNEFKDWQEQECTKVVIEFLRLRAKVAVDKLVVVDPEDRKAISEIQKDHKMLAELLNIISAYSMDAKSAAATIHQIEMDIPDY